MGTSLLGHRRVEMLLYWIVAMTLCTAPSALSQDCANFTTRRPVDTVVAEGSEACLYCDYPDRNTEQWEKDTTSIRPGEPTDLCDCVALSGIHVQPVTLCFNSVSRDDIGDYTCVQQLGFGRALGCTVRLSLADAPQITNRPSNPNITLSIGATCTITVTYSQGSPPASVEWRKDGVLITGPAISTSSSETTLTLTNSGPDVRGRYNVTMFNVGGSDTFVYNVKVEFAPVINLTHSRTSNGFRLTCNAIAYSRVESVRWEAVDSGSAIPGSNDIVCQTESATFDFCLTSTLDIESSNCDQAGYRCTVRNMPRTSSQSISVCPTAPPPPLENITITVLNCTAVSVSWPMITTTAVNSYIIEYRVAGTTTSWTPVLSSRPPVIIPDLMQGVQYEFRGANNFRLGASFGQILQIGTPCTEASVAATSSLAVSSSQAVPSSPSEPFSPAVQSSEFTIALSVLVPFSVLLMLVVTVAVPALIFKRRKKVETIQDYANTSTELLTRGNTLQPPPHLPPCPPPRQFPQQCHPHLPTHGNKISSATRSTPSQPSYTSSDPMDFLPTETATIEETFSKDKFSSNQGGLNMATAAGVCHSQQSPLVRPCGKVGSNEGAKVTDLVDKRTPQLHGEGHCEQVGTVYETIATYESVGNVYDKIGTYETIKPTSSSAHPTPSQPSQPTTRTDTPSQPSPRLTLSHNNPHNPHSPHNPQQPSQPSQPSPRLTLPHMHLTTRTDPPTQPSCNGSDDHLTANWMPTETSRKETSSKDNVCKISEGESNKGRQSMVKAVYERIATYETIGNVYDKIGTYETITATRSAAQPASGLMHPTQEETASSDKTPKRVNCVYEEEVKEQKMDSTAPAAGISYSSKHSSPVHARGSVGSSEVVNVSNSECTRTPPLRDESGHCEQLGIATYETVGNVYDRICTYE